MRRPTFQVFADGGDAKIFRFAAELRGPNQHAACPWPPSGACSVIEDYTLLYRKTPTLIYLDILARAMAVYASRVSGVALSRRKD